MSTRNDDVERLVGGEYRHGFVTDIESDTLPPGLDEGVVRAISARKQEPAFMLEFRLKAYRQTVDNFCQRLREYCTARGINYFLSPSNASLEALLLKQLREAELWA